MCCMLSIFHVSSQIVTSISELSLLFSLYALLEENISKKLLYLSLDIFKISFRLISLYCDILSYYFPLLMLQYVALFQPSELVMF